MAWLVNICCCISMRSCGVHCNGKLLFWLRFFHIRLRFCIYWSTFLCRLTWLFPDVRVIFSCIELVCVSELHCWLLADSLMWSLSSGQDIFSMCNMAGSEDLHLHYVSSMVLVVLGHRNFQPLLSKNFKAVLFPSWYFSVIVLLCLLPSRHAARILQIHLYSLPFIIWNVGRLLMLYLITIYGLCCHCATVLVTAPRAQVLYSWWPLLYMVRTALFEIIFLLLDNTIVLLALSYIFWETSIGQMVQYVDTEHSFSSWVRRSATFVNPIH